MMRALAILVVFLFSGCTERTEYGRCVGLGERQDPKLHYQLSAGNIVIAVVFVEFVAPPVYVLTQETFCPVGTEVVP